MNNYALITDIVEQKLLEARSFVRKLFFRNLEVQVNIGINDDEISQIDSDNGVCFPDPHHPRRGHGLD